MSRTNPTSRGTPDSMGGEPSNSTHRHAYGKRRDQPDTTDGPASVFDGIVVGERVDVRLSASPQVAPRTGVSRASRTTTHSTVSPPIRSAGSGTRPRGRWAHPVRPARLDPGRSYMCALDAGTHMSSVAVPNVHAETGFRLCWRVSRTCLRIQTGREYPHGNRLLQGSRPTAFRADRQRNADERPGQSAEVASITALAEHADLPETVRNLRTVADPPRHRQTFSQRCAIGYRCTARCVTRMPSPARNSRARPSWRSAAKMYH